MAKINLEKMELDQLKELQKDVQAAIASFEKRKKAEARAAVEAVAKEHGMSLNEILGGSTGAMRKSKASAKYRNPANKDQTWSGRGRQPAWYKEAISAGQTPASMEI